MLSFFVYALIIFLLTIPVCPFSLSRPFFPGSPDVHSSFVIRSRSRSSRCSSSLVSRSLDVQPSRRNSPPGTLENFTTTLSHIHLPPTAVSRVPLCCLYFLRSRNELHLLYKMFSISRVRQPIKDRYQRPLYERSSFPLGKRKTIAKQSVLFCFRTPSYFASESGKSDCSARHQML